MTAPQTQDYGPPPHDDDGVVEEILERVEVPFESMSAVEAINRSEIEAQIAAAHRFPRNVKNFMIEARAMISSSIDMAAACMYTLPRKKKVKVIGDDGREREIEVPVTGKSVRLAEICASCYRNFHTSSRTMVPQEKTISAQGMAWDIEKNYRVTMEADRRITNKNGKRYNDDMIVVTGQAAQSIAFRNAVFRVIPPAYTDELYAHARKVAVGDAKTFEIRRAAVFSNFGKLGVSTPRVLARVGRTTVEDVTPTDLEELIGLGTSIRQNLATIEECFGTEDKAGAPKPPSPAAADLEAKLRAQPPVAAPTAPSTKPPLEEKLHKSVEQAQARKAQDPPPDAGDAWEGEEPPFK